MRVEDGPEPSECAWVERGDAEEDQEADEEIPYIDCVPLEILAQIFSHFDLPTRGYASKVCRRWRSLLLSQSCRMKDVVVLNIFERSVWESHVKNNKGVRVKTIQMEEMEALKNISHLISEVNTVKFWYKNEDFARQCIGTVADSGMDLKTVDLYPYASELVLDEVHEKMPQLTGMTMRPHDKNYFWSGLEVHQFPTFSNLQTLCVDTINFNQTVVLPTSLTALEFLNRNTEKHFDLLRILDPLKNLESLSISHADFSKEAQFNDFLDAVDIQVLPKLAFLTLKFCKFPDSKQMSCSFVGGGHGSTLRKMDLKMLKLDLCYGPMDVIGQSLLSFNNDLKVLVLQIMNDIPVLNEVGVLSTAVARHKVWLHLAVMQRDGIRRVPSESDGNTPVVEFPAEFYKVLSKFEASFIDESNVFILDQVFQGAIAHCQEVKLINCPGATDAHMESLSKTCKFLRRISIISCDGVTEQGIIHYFSGFEARKSQKLEIVWKRKSRYPRPANTYLDIAHNHREILTGKKLRFSTKTFSDDSDGERVIMWERGTKKRLCLQDFSEPDEYRIIGVVVGKADDEPPTDAPPPVPEDVKEQRSRLRKLLNKTSV